MPRNIPRGGRSSGPASFGTRPRNEAAPGGNKAAPATNTRSGMFWLSPGGFAGAIKNPKPAAKSMPRKRPLPKPAAATAPMPPVKTPAAPNKRSMKPLASSFLTRAPRRGK